MAAPTRLGTKLRRSRFVRFLVLFVVLVAVEIGTMVLAQLLARQYHAFAGVIVLTGAGIGSIVALLAYAGCVRWMEKRAVAELALHALPGGLLVGTAIGAALFTAVIALLAIMGNATVAVPAAAVFPAAACAMAIVSGVTEELVFRGALFRLFEERFGTLVALLVSAGLFGALHIANPGATLTSSIAISLEAGLLLALAYTATRTLWLPIGLHFAWNFTEGGVFGTAVSGGKATGLLKTTLSGPQILTGGAFGPEASVVAVAACLVAASAFLLVTLRRHAWRPLSWGSAAL